MRLPTTCQAKTLWQTSNRVKLDTRPLISNEAKTMCHETRALLRETRLNSICNVRCTLNLSTVQAAREVECTGDQIIEYDSTVQSVFRYVDNKRTPKIINQHIEDKQLPLRLFKQL